MLWQSRVFSAAESNASAAFENEGHSRTGWSRCLLWWIEHSLGPPSPFWNDEIPGLRLFCRLRFWLATCFGWESGDSTASLPSFWSCCGSGFFDCITTSWHNPHQNEPSRRPCIFLFNCAGDLGRARPLVWMCWNNHQHVFFQGCFLFLVLYILYFVFLAGLSSLIYIILSCNKDTIYWKFDFRGLSSTMI